MSSERKPPARKPEPKPPPLSGRLAGLIVFLAVLTIVGLTIADYFDDHSVHREWIAALLFIALTFGGYGADRIFGKWFGP